MKVHQFTSIGSWLLPPHCLNSVKPTLSPPTLSPPTGPAQFVFFEALVLNCKNHAIHASLPLLIPHLPTEGPGPRKHVCLSLHHFMRAEHALHLSIRNAHKPLGITGSSGIPHYPLGPPLVLCRDLWTTLALLPLINTEWLHKPKRQKLHRKNYIFTLEQRQGFIWRVLLSFF